MNRERMGLGTDQWVLPEQLASGPPPLPLMPPPPRGAGSTPDPQPAPSHAALAGLAPWAVQMQLPGMDT